MGVGKKMKIILDKNHIKQAVFAQENNESFSTLNKVLNGYRPPTLELIIKFKKKFPNVDLNWLLIEENSSELKIISEPDITYNKTATALEKLKEIDDKMKDLKLILSQS